MKSSKHIKGHLGPVCWWRFWLGSDKVCSEPIFLQNLSLLWMLHFHDHSFIFYWNRLWILFPFHLRFEVHKIWRSAQTKPMKRKYGFCTASHSEQISLDFQHFQNKHRSLRKTCHCFFNGLWKSLNGIYLLKSTSLSKKSLT